MQTGTVTAQENPPNFIRAQKFHEVQKYLMKTDHVPQLQSLFVSEQKFVTLDPKVQSAIVEAAKETLAWTSSQAKDAHAADLAWLTTEGKMQVIDVNLTGIQDLIAKVPEEVAGAEGRKLYDRVMALKP